jgi:hypothetical protein
VNQPSQSTAYIPVVDVDQTFPLVTTDLGGRGTSSGGGQAGQDQAPVVTNVLRDVLGWRPRVEDTQAFTSALKARFKLETVEGHVVSRYLSGGLVVQADLGGITGGQASLYARAVVAQTQMTQLLGGLRPLRNDSDPQDCEAYRTLVRDSINRLVNELGAPGGPRVPLVDAAFTMLTGMGGPLTLSSGCGCGCGGDPLWHDGSWSAGVGALPSRDPDTIPGQLGALRDRFGLTDDNVNNIDEEGVRTSFWTLVDVITDLETAWLQQRTRFTTQVDGGFVGTNLVLLNRLMHAAAEQVDELEAILDSVLVTRGERQTLDLDQKGLTLDGLLAWVRSFVAEDGPRIARDTGRDGILSSFTPTVAALESTFRRYVANCLIAGRPSSLRSAMSKQAQEVVSAEGLDHGVEAEFDRECCPVSWLPVDCCSKFPAGMSSARVQIAVGSLCRLLRQLLDKALRIGRYPGVLLLDVEAREFPVGELVTQQYSLVSLRGLHLQPHYVPALVGWDEENSCPVYKLPLRGTSSYDTDTLSGVFATDDLPPELQGSYVLTSAEDVAIAIVDGNTGRVVVAPKPVTWPFRRDAANPVGLNGVRAAAAKLAKTDQASAQRLWTYRDRTREQLADSDRWVGPWPTSADLTDLVSTVETDPDQIPGEYWDPRVTDDGCPPPAAAAPAGGGTSGTGPVLTGAGPSTDVGPPAPDDQGALAPFDPSDVPEELADPEPGATVEAKLATESLARRGAAEVTAKAAKKTQPRRRPSK